MHTAHWVTCFQADTCLTKGCPQMFSMRHFIQNYQDIKQLKFGMKTRLNSKHNVIGLIGPNDIEFRHHFHQLADWHDMQHPTIPVELHAF